MKRIKVRALLLCLGMGAVSCTVSPDDIRLDEVGRVTMDGVSLSQARLTLRLTAANDSRARVAVHRGDFTIGDAQGPIAELSLDEEIVLRPKSATTLDLPLSLRFKGPLGTAMALPRLMNADPAALFVNGSIRVRGGIAARTIEVNRMPVSQFLALLGVADLESLF